jgi:alpha-beta hydrolase superfamily lysophospholipase
MTIPTFPGPDQAEHREGFLHARDHLRLFWQRFVPRAPRATAIVLHGGGDHSGRYPALASALVRAGLEAALVDLRGHGQSDGRRWHVDTFGEYLSDFDRFVAMLREEVPDRPRFVVAHSMGALVATLWGLEHGGEVGGFVLSSPYFGLAARPSLAKEVGARIVGKLVPWFPVATGLAFEDLTSDEEMQGWTARDHLYGRKTTPRWFVEAARAQAEALRRAPEFRAPLRVLAGSADRVADVGAERRFCDRAGSADKDFLLYEGFRHELFNERGRARPIADAVGWIEGRLAASKTR